MKLRVYGETVTLTPQQYEQALRDARATRCRCGTCLICVVREHANETQSKKGKNETT